MPPRTSRRASKSRAAQPAGATKEPGETRKSSSKARAPAKLPDHPQHHRMIARNLNGLLENMAELRSDLLAERRDHRTDFKKLDRKLFMLQNDLEKLAASHANFMEEMTSVAFEANLDLRGALNAIEAVWDAMAEVAPGKKDTVAARRRETREREKSRVAAIDDELRALAGSATENRKKTKS